MSRTPLSVDDRFELAMLSTQRERLNRPVWFVLVGAFALAVSVLVMLWAWGSYAEARGRLTSQAQVSARIKSSIDYLRELDSMGKTGPDESLAPFTGVVSTLEAASVSVGMTHQPPRPSTPSNPQSRNGVKQLTYSYRQVKDEKVERLMSWVEKALKDVPGLVVRDVVLRREANGWNLDITFSRLERAS